MSDETPADVKGTCFVVMGFGKKTDFETGRTLDLDKTYRNIIKPAVKAAGLKCIRADEIVHSGVIDVPMYEQLLNADVVVADLSTSNKNAFYELGVRHALRPFTTIVISEDGVKSFPFDVNHVLIRQYHHLGEGIDFDEVERFRKVLTGAIAEIFDKDPRPRDSPVYTFLNSLTPPSLAAAMQGVAEAAAMSAPVVAEAAGRAGAPADAHTHSEMMQEVDEAQKNGDFAAARSLLKLIRKRMSATAPEYPYITQRLALVTYKSKSPSEEQALREARELLETLQPETSNDTETLGLWGAVHKRLWDKTRAADALNDAVRGYERGFYLRNDYYNGINFAFLLNVRAAHAADLARDSGDPEEVARHRSSSIADFVQARRVRDEVLSICDQWLASNPASGEKYWVLATKAEAILGMGMTAEAEQVYQEAYSLPSAQSWMVESTKEQRAKLQALLAESPLKYVKADGE
jgi:hypothetical protein